MAKRWKYCWRARVLGEDAETIAELVTALREAADNSAIRGQHSQKALRAIKILGHLGNVG